MNTPAASVVGPNEISAAASTITVTTESSSIPTTAEQMNDQRREISPIVYDVHTISTIGGNSTPPVNRGGIGRQRPFSSGTSLKNTMNKVYTHFCYFQFQACVDHGQHAAVSAVEEVLVDEDPVVRAALDLLLVNRH